MNPGMEARPVPEWLRDVDQASEFPVRDVLQGSLYYPASGLDGDPIRYLGGFVHSFVYVDYGYSKDTVKESLFHHRRRFAGYRVKFLKDLKEADLVPNGWRPMLPDPARDGTPPVPPARHQSNSTAEDSGQWQPPAHGRVEIQPFAYWAVHERLPEHDDEHGPERFSLLYIGADGAAAFQALYHGNQCAPYVIAIINPGTGFGGNWTDYRDPNQVLGRSVLQNPHGVPGWLLFGSGRRRTEEPECCWPDYREQVTHWKVPEGWLALWSK